MSYVCSQYIYMYPEEQNFWAGVELAVQHRMSKCTDLRKKTRPLPCPNNNNNHHHRCCCSALCRASGPCQLCQLHHKLSTSRPSLLRLCPNSCFTIKTAKQAFSTIFTILTTLIMSSLILPFKPRPPMPYTPPTASYCKALCRFLIFPNYHRMPTSNAPCAQFQIRRKELDSRILQLNQLKALKETVPRHRLATQPRPTPPRTLTNFLSHRPPNHLHSNQPRCTVHPYAALDISLPKPIILCIAHSRTVDEGLGIEKSTSYFTYFIAYTKVFTLVHPPVFLPEC
jgi:hypothetical protein